MVGSKRKESETSNPETDLTIKMYDPKIEYQSLKEDNEDLRKELQLLQSQKERARTKAEDILQRINDIESSA